MRLYEPAAYAPQSGSYWAQTVDQTVGQTGTGSNTGNPPGALPALQGDLTCDVAVIGGGFTGLNAALTLAQAGMDVVVLEAEHPGWGASGRNGGFCCLGGALASDARLTRRHGTTDGALWQDMQAAAIDHVAQLLHRHGISADTHSDGETVLAHSPRAWRALQAEAAQTPATRLLPRDALAREGLGGPWLGGLTRRAGFALNPAKYHDGLARAAIAAGVRLYPFSPVTAMTQGAPWRLRVRDNAIRARRVILATNGYSAEDLPDWMRARTLPVQSSIIVTRPLSDSEQQAAGWTSAQMAYDTRVLLHYFRLLPERRFLFGMRGGLTARPAERRQVAARIRRDFHAAFPAWRDVEITHDWSGLVCLMASGHPFMGAVPGHDGLFAVLGFHGNGVAMGSYLGHCLADSLAQGPVRARARQAVPGFLAQPPKRFALGPYRRALLRPAYWAAETLDL